MKRLVTPLLMAIAAVVGVVVGHWSRPYDAAPAVYSHETSTSTTPSPIFGGFKVEGSNKLQYIIDIINSSYVDEVNTDTLVEALIPQLLENLDPHSVYIAAKDLQRTNEELSSNFGGIGVSFNIRRDTVNVISVISGGPSSRLGVMPGDKIIKVNGHDFVGAKLTNDMVMDSLRGTIGTKVNITVLRDNATQLDFEITRGVIPMYSVDVTYMLDETVGYMRIDRFAEKTYEEMMTGLAKLKTQGCQTVVVDLRSNSGGYLDVVIRMCNEFLSSGDMIVYTEGLHNERENVRASGTGVFRDMGVVVLIDEYSASASEIFAGAMQDNDRGVVVGRRSFGKGLVQSQHLLPDGSAMRITIARYHTPSGRCIQRPYDKGKDEYYGELKERYSSGEAYSQDSVRQDQSQVFYTKNGRKVFGGGGIMPDIYIPTDSVHASRYYVNLRTKGHIYDFALGYANAHRKELEQMDTKELIAHLRGLDLLPELTNYAQKKGLAQSTISAAERPYIDNELKATIARNIKDNDAYYPMINELDAVVKKAVEIAQPAEN